MVTGSYVSCLHLTDFAMHLIWTGTEEKGAGKADNEGCER